MAEAQLDLRDKIQYYQNQVQPGKGKNLTDEQLLQAFRKQPDEEQKQAFMIIHSQTLSQLTKVIQQKQIADIIETEQLILSGANEKLEA